MSGISTLTQEGPISPEQPLTTLSVRVAALEANLKTIEPSLRFFINNVQFFQELYHQLDPRLKNIEALTSDSLPARLRSLEKISETIDRQSEIQEIRKTLDDFHRDATAIYATKEDLKTARSDSELTPKTKGKMALPDSFSGKRDDWKTFASHLTLYLTANESLYPTDTDKITFAISRLGDGSAFKYMMQYIPKLKEPPALLQLRQKGSAIDYTTKFQELASDLDWNDPALISHYRRGLKAEVVKVIDILPNIPITFTSFVQKAIEIDSKQYASYLDLHNRSSTTHQSKTTNNPKMSNIVPRTTTPAATPSPNISSPYSPSMAMDLSQARHISIEEKKR
ncbi:Retrotransposon-derived protein peg10 [Linnemannia zychae]|nr:Retrotransposon-derived protein peg10 [Linnemannia zychae]